MNLTDVDRLTIKLHRASHGPWFSVRVGVIFLLGNGKEIENEAQRVLLSDKRQARTNVLATTPFTGLLVSITTHHTPTLVWALRQAQLPTAAPHSKAQVKCITPFSEHYNMYLLYSQNDICVFCLSDLTAGAGSPGTVPSASLHVWRHAVRILVTVWICGGAEGRPPLLRPSLTFL